MPLRDKLKDFLNIEIVKQPKWLTALGAGIYSLVYGYYLTRYYEPASLIGGLMFLGSIPFTIRYYDKEQEEKQKTRLENLFNELNEIKTDQELIEDLSTILRNYGNYTQND